VTSERIGDGVEIFRDERGVPAFMLSIF